MRRNATIAILFLLTIQPLLIPAVPVQVHAAGGSDVLGDLYAGTSDPGVVYRYVGGTEWEAISPLPYGELADRAPRTPYRGPCAQPPAQSALGKAVLDLISYEGHLYAGTVSQSGTGQVWRHDGGTAWILVGDDLDDGVFSLQSLQGDLYAATGACGTSVYKYTPGTAVGSAGDWTLQTERAGLCGIGDGQLRPLAAAPCVHDCVEHRGGVYLAAETGIMRRSLDGARWDPVLTLRGGRVSELETLQGLLYAGYDSGELWATEGVSWPDELVFSAQGGIRAMTTDGRALYVGTGEVPGSHPSEGKIYRLADPAGLPEPISGGLGASIETLLTVAPSGLDLSKLQRGDILLVRGPGAIEGVIGFVATYLGGTYWIHGGMYAGEATVVESSSAVAEDFGKVRITPISETLFWEEGNYWAVIRVKQQSARDPATSYAEAQEGDLYNIDYPFWGLPVKTVCDLLGPIIGIDPAICCVHPVSDRETEDDCFYCTHLPWRAYHTQGINLDSDAAWPARLIAAQSIPGDDMYYDDDITLVDQRKGLHAVVISAVGSPADMLVIDPQGRRTGVDPDTGEILDEIPEITYGRIDLPPVLDFFLPDKWESDFVAIPNLVDTWEIRITGAKRGDYTLGAELVDWQHHFTQTITRTIDKGETSTFRIAFPSAPGGLIIRASEVYLPLVMRAQ